MLAWVDDLEISSDSVCPGDGARLAETLALCRSLRNISFSPFSQSRIPVDEILGFFNNLSANTGSQLAVIIVMNAGLTDPVVEALCGACRRGLLPSLRSVRQDGNRHARGGG